MKNSEEFIVSVSDVKLLICSFSGYLMLRNKPLQILAA